MPFGTATVFYPEATDPCCMEDVTGKRIINTRLRPNITIREENATAALEAISRYAADPKWLIYMPPTMSPSETSKREDLLEHPEEAFSCFQKRGVGQVVCQEKHMGSRAIVIVCRDQDAARPWASEGVGYRTWAGLQTTRYRTLRGRILRSPSKNTLCSSHPHLDGMSTLRMTIDDHPFETWLALTPFPPFSKQDRNGLRGSPEPPYTSRVGVSPWHQVHDTSSVCCCSSWVRPLPTGES